MPDSTTIFFGATALILNRGGILGAVAYTSGRVRSELATIGGKVEDLSKADGVKSDGLSHSKNTDG